MKVSFFVACLMLFGALSAFGQTGANDYRVVFDLTGRDSLEQQAVVRWIKEVTTANPNAQVEIVMYGKGLDLVMPERSTVANDVKNALKNPNVTFAVCQVAMKNNHVEKSQLMEGVQTVPDGIYEIISKQRQGWGYIKVAR